MADPTPAPITLTATWTDLYAASGIAVGDPVLLNCRGASSIFVAEAASIPDPTFAGIEIKPATQMIVDRGAVGLWARTQQGGRRSGVVIQIDRLG